MKAFIVEVAATVLFLALALVLTGALVSAFSYALAGSFMAASLAMAAASLAYVGGYYAHSVNHPA